MMNILESAIQHYLTNPCYETAEKLHTTIRESYDSKLITWNQAIALANRFSWK